MANNEKISTCCDVGGCPYSHEEHGHMPASVRLWKPENRLTISQEAQDIAKVILNSYDGLVEVDRCKAELEQQLLSERVAYSAEYGRFLEIVRNFGALATT